MNNITKSLFGEYIKGFRLRELFNYLGWDNDRTQIPPLKIDGVIYQPKILADKNGFKIVECSSEIVPLYPVRSQILGALRVKFAEIMVIFTDTKKTRQVWMYGYKLGTQNKKAECEYRAGQEPQALYERTAGLFFSLDEEDNITIVDVTARVRSHFTQNAERVTKRFYTEFKAQHTALLGFIEGITSSIDKDWYASIMLNRLMFCYFMQRRGFLNQDKDYLRNKLNESKEKLGKGKFYSFYRSFLLTLFQKGFGTFHHTPEVVDMIGRIPYLNGGLFDLHEIEQHYPDIDISDEAFERIFNLFDRYEWHLDTRECASGNEISPDVLGYIFEKYINDRAKMGAYYTQEDITGYISRSTILPYLLEATNKAYAHPFAPDGAVWKHLRESGDRYIFDSVKCGADAELPENITVGLDTTAPNLIERRKDWNKPVPDSVNHLPTETWREFIERTNRYRATLAKIESGGIIDTADFVTYNLDIITFVNDLLDTIEDPKFIKVFYAQLEKVTVLDPTCGSGAFLFAALNILEPLYDSCLSRMEDYLSHDYKGSLERSVRREFDRVLEKMENILHHNKKYFIYKSIILNNLYGVDIMKEAAETAKLRLFLKLVSTAEPNYRTDNLGIEPLPDIDFNIKAGNALIGFANEEEVEESLHESIILAPHKITETKDAMFQLSKAVSRYKQLQLGEGDYRADDFNTAKVALTARQVELRKNLDSLLRGLDYSAVSDEDWNNNYQPFHWVSEFYSIVVENGGFDVVIGNPPYVGYTRKDKDTKKAVIDCYTVKNYKTLVTSNLYSFVIERSRQLSHNKTKMGMIIPISAFSTSKMAELRKFLLANYGMHISTFHQRPAQLFEGVLQRLCIFIASPAHWGLNFTSGVYRWYTEGRRNVFENIFYQLNRSNNDDYVWKIGNETEQKILNKYLNNKPIMNYLDEKNDKNKIFYRTAGGGYWVTILNSEFDSKSLSNKNATFNDKTDSRVFSAVLNSNLYWWYYSVNYDLFNFKDYMLFGFKFTYNEKQEACLIKLSEKMERFLLDSALYYTIKSRTRGNNETVTYHKEKTKLIMDEIDTLLAQHYGFTEEELDYIINYDIKYRMGLSGSDPEGGEDE